MNIGAKILKKILGNRIQQHDRIQQNPTIRQHDQVRFISGRERDGQTIHKKKRTRDREKSEMISNQKVTRK